MSSAAIAVAEAATGGGLGGQAEAYLRMRRTLGYQLTGHDQMLTTLVAAADRAGQAQLTVDTILAWAISSPTGAHRRAVSRTQAVRRLSVARRFAVYLSAFDPATQVPPAGLLSAGTVRTTPFIFTAAQVQALLAAARRLSPQLHAASMTTLIALLACTGLRPGEGRRLDRDDVDLAGAVLTVRNTKLGKSRIVPLHPSTVTALARYARRRDRLCPEPSEPAFVLSASAGRYTPAQVSSTFRRLCQHAQISTPPGQRPPRAHDLRHTFAVDTLTGWHADGLDVQPRLPALSTYLGHLNPASTYWYCQAVPQLMSVVADRVHPDPNERVGS